MSLHRPETALSERKRPHVDRIWIMFIGMLLMMWFVSRRQRAMQEVAPYREGSGVRQLGSYHRRLPARSSGATVTWSPGPPLRGRSVEQAGDRRSRPSAPPPSKESAPASEQSRTASPSELRRAAVVVSQAGQLFHDVERGGSPWGLRAPPGAASRLAESTGNGAPHGRALSNPILTSIFEAVRSTHHLQEGDTCQ